MSIPSLQQKEGLKSPLALQSITPTHLAVKNPVCSRQLHRNLWSVPGTEHMTFSRSQSGLYLGLDLNFGLGRSGVPHMQDGKGRVP